MKYVGAVEVEGKMLSVRFDGENRASVESNVTDLNEQMTLYKVLTFFVLNYYNTLQMHGAGKSDEERYELIKGMADTAEGDTGEEKDENTLIFKRMVCKWLDANLSDKSRANAVNAFGVLDVTLIISKALVMANARIPKVVKNLNIPEIKAIERVIFDCVNELLDTPDIHKVLKDFAASAEVNGVGVIDNTGILN